MEDSNRRELVAILFGTASDVGEAFTNGVVFPELCVLFFEGVSIWSLFSGINVVVPSFAGFRSLWVGIRPNCHASVGIVACLFHDEAARDLCRYWVARAEYG